MAADAFSCVCGFLQIFKRIGERADLVYQAALHRLLTGEDSPDVVCKLACVRHQARIVPAAYPGVRRDKAHYALLHSGEILIGLRRTYDNEFEM